MTPPADPSPAFPVGDDGPHTLPPATPLVARASATVRNKNLLIILMCSVFLAWFGYDAFVKYAREDDALVDRMKASLEANPRLPIDFLTLKSWPGWNNADTAQRDAMTAVAREQAKVDGWHTETDIATQKYIVLGLAAAVVAALWWFFHCQSRRAIADQSTVSPACGIVIPWEKITRIDNTRWKSTGIVEITYRDDDGAPRTARFDDYELDREPLLEILDRMADKALHAELIPKDEPAASAPLQGASEA